MLDGVTEKLQGQRMNQTPALPASVFVVGASYSCRSACDHNCTWTFKVTARTNKSVTRTGDFPDAEKTQTKRIKADEYGENVFPMGKYSMAPLLRSLAKQISPL